MAKDKSDIILLSSPKSSVLPLVRRKEKRRYKRYPVDSRLIVMSKNVRGKESRGWCLNISKGGARIMINQKLTIGEILEIKIERANDWRKVTGRVVWVKPLADGCIAGIAFIES